MLDFLRFGYPWRFAMLRAARALRSVSQRLDDWLFPPEMRV